jgi:DNA-binding response OmpR family regulator
MNILILDDQPRLAQMLAMSLCAAGHSAKGFTSVTEALAAIMEADLLVTDFHMPEMTGMEVVRRAYDQGWRGAVLIMSGAPTRIGEPLDHPLVRMGMVKPFATCELVEAVAMIEHEKTTAPE